MLKVRVLSNEWCLVTVYTIEVPLHCSNSSQLTITICVLKLQCQTSKGLIYLMQQLHRNLSHQEIQCLQLRLRRLTISIIIKLQTSTIIRTIISLLQCQPKMLNTSSRCCNTGMVYKVQLLRHSTQKNAEKTVKSKRCKNMTKWWLYRNNSNHQPNLVPKQDSSCRVNKISCRSSRFRIERGLRHRETARSLDTSANMPTRS